MIGAIFICIVLLFLGRPYPYSEVTNTGNRFITALLDRNYESAFQLTVKNTDVGETLPAFAANAQKEFGFTHASATGFSFGAPTISPLQTFGNRLRRWYEGRKVDEREVDADYKIKTETTHVPVRIHFVYQSDGTWKITRFQAHRI